MKLSNTIAFSSPFSRRTQHESLMKGQSEMVSCCECFEGGQVSAVSEFRRKGAAMVKALSQCKTFFIYTDRLYVSVRGVFFLCCVFPSTSG